jgi:hypothetical protein
LFKPAGALFPFDASTGKNGGKLRLSWSAGVDAVFFRELALANYQQPSRIPSNFDWLRFRELFKTDVINEAVRKNPWLVDWNYVAERTLSSSFDRRRLVPQAVQPVSIPVPAGLWFGTSPFAEPLLFTGSETPVFPTHSGVNVWVSSHGILRCTNQAWVFIVWE